LARGIDPADFEQVASSYREVARSAASDLNKAAMVSRLTEAGGKSVKKVRVPNDDNAPFLPRGAMAHFRSLDASRLKPGSFVILRRGGDVSIRRFIRLQVTTNALLIHVARVNGPLEKPITPSSLVGQIVAVEVKDKTVDPTPPATVEDFFTEFGTCSVGTKMMRFLKALLPARFRRVSEGSHEAD